MPTLDWIGKKAVVNHHLEVAYRLLKCDVSLSAGDTEAGNLLVQGDNLLALKALLPYYAGQVKCIYIDPPYNTGKEKWKYNDNVNSPEIRKWMGEVVGEEGEDLSRHEKWLCMMYPRIQLLSKFLRHDGIIFISIDDNEINNLRLLMDEIFGQNNFICMLVWKKRKGGGNDSFFVAVDHEYVLVYAKRKKAFEKKWRIAYEEKYLKRYREEDEIGRFYWDTLSRAGLNNPIIYDVKCPDGSIIHKGTWQISDKTFEEKKKAGDIKFIQNDSGGWTVLHKVRLPEGKVFRSIYVDSTNKDAADEMLELLDDKKAFPNPKPVGLVKSLISLASGRNSLVMDSFAGSGTTGHGVLQLNKEDGGNRRFILVEMDEDICQNKTAVRLKRVLNGYSNKEGLGGGFRYCRLGEPLFDELGNIREDVKFNDLAHHIFFSETGLPLPKNAKKNSPLVGIHNGVAYYLLFNGILGDKTINGGNMLTSKILGQLPKHDGPKIIFGEGTRMGKTRLRKENIMFRQIPYEVKTN